MNKFKILLTAAVVVLASSTGCKKDKKIVVNPYYCTMEINGVPYEIPYEKYYSLSGGGVTYGAGAMGSFEYLISFRRTKYFPQTELKFVFAGNTLPDEDTVINPYGILFNYASENQSIDIENGKLVFVNKTLDSLTGYFDFDGRLYNAGDAVWIPTDSIVKVRKGKFCIKPSNL